MARAKFRCLSKTGIETHTVHLEPVVHEKQEHEKNTLEARADGSVLHPGADRSFFAGYPHASIFLTALTPEAAADFEEGQETWVEFHLVREPESNPG